MRIPIMAKDILAYIVNLDSLKRNSASLLKGVWDCGIMKVLVWGGFW
jgi:hypothetical protein